MTSIVLTRSKYKKEIPLGLMTLKSYLDQTSHSAQIFDLSLEGNSIAYLEEIVLNENIDFVGISVGSITYKADLGLMERLKSTTKAKIVIGGAFANTPEVFDKVADKVITGRGEEKLLKLLDEFDNIQSIIPNNKINFASVNFNDYDAPRDFNGNREFPLYTSMGCKFGCLYCSIPQINEHLIWLKDLSTVYQEITDVLSKGITHLRFVDDLFGVDRLRTSFLLSQIKKTKGLQGIYTQLRIDCTEKDLLEDMRNSSFSGIYFGIESPNEETLKKIGKPYTQQKIREVLQFSRELGFDITGAFTIGYPWETREEIKNTLIFANEMKQQFNLRPSIYIVTPFAGSPLSTQIKEEVIKIKDYTLWDARHAVMDTVNLKREDIQEIYDSYKISLSF